MAEKITRDLNERGFTTTFFAIMMPVILALMGLCADGALVIYQRISLETATDAASRSAIDAYDREIWLNERRVVLDQGQAEAIVNEVLLKNNLNASLVNLDIPEDNPSECRITTEMDVPLFFLRIFGIGVYTIQTSSVAHGYADGEGGTE